MTARRNNQWRWGKQCRFDDEDDYDHSLGYLSKGQSYYFINLNLFICSKLYCVPECLTLTWDIYLLVLGFRYCIRHNNFDIHPFPWPHKTSSSRYFTLSYCLYRMDRKSVWVQSIYASFRVLRFQDLLYYSFNITRSIDFIFTIPVKSIWNSALKIVEMTIPLYIFYYLLSSSDIFHLFDDSIFDNVFPLADSFSGNEDFWAWVGKKLEW